MSQLNQFEAPPELVLGRQINERLPKSEQLRQRAEIEAILLRLREQPGVILADEVGLGKTFVALGVIYTVATQRPKGPVMVMVPPNLVEKWEHDLKTFCQLYLSNRQAVPKDGPAPEEAKGCVPIRYAVVRHSVELLRLLDDPSKERCHVIFLAQGVMGRKQTDKWVRLALIAAALRRHGRGGATRLIQVKRQIHRFVAELVHAVGEQNASDEGEDLWRELLSADPSTWQEIYNRSLRPGQQPLYDNPVPRSVVRVLGDSDFDLSALAEALKRMPVREKGGAERVSERIDVVRQSLRQIEPLLWKRLLAMARWRSPLLVMDEAHHLKNPDTSLARQLQKPESEEDMRTGDGALAQVFDRMLFLTATPFQLGHSELVRVLDRFGDVRWDEATLGDHETFKSRITALEKSLTDSQRTAIGFQRCWSRLRPEDGPNGLDVDKWWEELLARPAENRSPRQRSVIDAYKSSLDCRNDAANQLRPWVIRHNKPDFWNGTSIPRRERSTGATIAGEGASGGLVVPSEQVLPFFLAARSAAARGKDLLSEALCSSYEAFRDTRKSNVSRDGTDDEPEAETGVEAGDIRSKWYLEQFDATIEKCSGGIHPKIAATVKKTVDLWEQGEKVLVFAFYRHTCRSLRLHISQEIERRMASLARRRMAGAGHASTDQDIQRILSSIENRFFDRATAPGRMALDRALRSLVDRQSEKEGKAQLAEAERDQLVDVMRRFLRVQTTLVRCFPIHEHDSLEPHLAVRSMLDTADGSGLSWRNKFDGFLSYLLDCCSPDERYECLEAASSTQTGKIRVMSDENGDDAPDGAKGTTTLANIQIASGSTRRSARSRLMRAFNTPFFPDVLVCSQVMGEGVDLQRSCRHIIHHDLAWNPSTIEQRTGRIDRLGCKAEGRHPIRIYLPYLAGTADERQFKVMCDREQWFRIVMGQDVVANLIRADDEPHSPPLPKTVELELAFQLGL